MRSLVLKLCISFFSLILTFIIFDALIQFIPGFHRLDYYSPNLLYNHPVHGYQTVPNSTGYYERADFINLLRYNNYGRHDYHVSRKMPGKKRIVVLGGSFSAGMEVPIEKTWPKIFESKLNEDYEVVNMSHQAKRFNYFARFLDDNFFSEFEPDYIIFAFSDARINIRGDVAYEGNEMSCQRGSSYKGFSYLYGPEDEEIIKRAIDVLTTAAYFPVMLYETYPKFRRSNILNYLVKFQEQRLGKNHPEFINISISGNFVMFANCDKQLKVKNTVKYVSEIKKIIEKHSVPVLFFFITQKHNLKKNRDLSKRIPLFFTKDDYVIDLFNDFKNDIAQRKKKLYWENDGHPNDEGYKVIAESVYRHFIDWQKQKESTARRLHGGALKRIIKE